MASWRTVEWGVVGIILLTAVASSAAFGGEDLSGASYAEVGDGTATVTVDSLPTDELRIDDGRFGTGVVYLRVPDVRIDVGDVEDDPRIVYRVQVPSLDVDLASTASLSGRGGQTMTVSGVDKAFDPESITVDKYAATVTVRVQSFDVDETVVSENATVEVVR